MSTEQRLQIYVVNGSDGWCLVAVRLIVGVRYLERPLREIATTVFTIIIIIIFVYTVKLTTLFFSARIIIIIV